MKKLDNIDHVAIQVHDIKKSLKWFFKTFDCEKLYSDETWALIGFENTKIALVKKEEHPPHIAIIDDSISNDKNIVVHRDGSKSKYISDKDSNFFELITYKK